MAERVGSGPLLAPLIACAEGRVPPNVALMQLFAAAPNEAAAHHALHTAETTADDETASQRIREMRQHWDENAYAFPLVKEIARIASPSSGEPADWAATFDEVARISVEGAVALYSFGNPSLLAGATDELVAQLRIWGLLCPEFCVLDLGCGFGRVSQAIATEVHRVVALEVSGRMAGLAQTALATRKNALVIHSAGNDLSFLRAASFDVVLAVDTFPYLVDCGISERHMADIARVLKSTGRLLIMNYSYRGNLASDRTEVEHLAAAYGFAIERNGTRDLSLWDGRAFLLRRI
jgi:SAM-dependent methyltransferase